MGGWRRLRVRIDRSPGRPARSGHTRCLGPRAAERSGGRWRFDGRGRGPDDRESKPVCGRHPGVSKDRSGAAQHFGRQRLDAGELEGSPPRGSGRSSRRLLV